MASHQQENEERQVGSGSSESSTSRSMAIESLLNPSDDDALTASSNSSRDCDSRSRSGSIQSFFDDDSTVRGHRTSLPIRVRQESLTDSASLTAKPRENRPTYLMEEVHFIWYHRVDLRMDWVDVKQAYNEQFPTRQRRGFQGIQCKYYRCMSNSGLPGVRQRDRSARPEERYGMRARTGLVYPWMRDRAAGL